MLQVIFRISKESKNLLRESYFIRRGHSTFTENGPEEVRIPVPWGHIAGKWWGNQNTTPILAIHGWQDNANSFDNLIPYLNATSVLAIDLPGHGFSSHIPEGIAFDFGEHMITLHRIAKYYNWNSFSFLGHSYGGALGFAYASFFPEKVKWLITLECARSFSVLPRMNLPLSISSCTDNYIKLDNLKKQSLPPAYKLSQMIRKTIEGSLGSVSTPEAAMILLKRGTLPADDTNSIKKETVKEKTCRINIKDSDVEYFDSDLLGFLKMEICGSQARHPEKKKPTLEAYDPVLKSLEIARENMNNFELSEDIDKYYIYTRDPTIKVLIFEFFNFNLSLEAAKNIKCPYLSIRAAKGFLQGKMREVHDKTVEILKSSPYYFEHLEVDGTHHVHLNSPENLAPVINGKWWGSKNQRPLLCIHGWQDNANTFDKLIPYMPSELSYFAIDLPGHGISSHLPRGILYRLYGIVNVIRRIQYHFKWDKVSLMGHSYGAACSFLFSSSYPKDVDYFIAIDILKPLSQEPESVIKTASEKIEKFLLYDSFCDETSPNYEYNSLIKKWIEGSKNSLTHESCVKLMERGVREANGLFKLNRDDRVKVVLAQNFTQREILNLAHSIKCSILYLKAKDCKYYEREKNVLEVLNVLKDKAKYVEYHELPGTHHLHLNTPEVVAPVINSFIKNIGEQQ